MKNYKNAVPIALIFLMALSIYSMYQDNQSKITQRTTYIVEAKDYAEKGIVNDAVISFKNALSMEKDLSISLEIGKLYEEYEMERDALKWGKELVKSYPREPEAYTYLLRQYYVRKDYAACFSLYDEIQKKELAHEEIQAIMNEIEYEYILDYDLYDEVSIFNGGYCAVSREDRWGFVSNTGTLAVGCKYDAVSPFISEVAAVNDQGDWYYIDGKGNKKIVVQNIEKCTYLGPIIENRLVAADGNLYAYYNTDFEKLSEDYENASSSYSGYAAVQQNGKWYIQKDETVISEKAYDSIVSDERGIIFLNSRMFGVRNEKYYLLDEEGKEMSAGPFEDVQPFYETNSLAAVQIGHKWGFIDKSGDLVIEPAYTAARSFSNGYAAVESNGSWGFINTNGEFAVEPVFEGAKDMNNNGCAFVQVKNQWKLLKLYKYNH